MVSLSCGYNCLRVLLIIMNVVVSLCGIALIVVGSIAVANFNKYESGDDAYLKAFVIFIVAFGCFMTLIGIFGFCGACKKSVYCLTLYIIFLSIFILAGLAAGIAGFVLKDKVKNYVDQSIIQAFGKYGDPNYKKLIDAIQKDLHCCGPYGNWTESQPVPDSCKSPEGTLYTEGCVDNVRQFFQKNILIVAVCVFCFALLQILGIVFAVCVCQAIKRGETA